MLNQVLSSSVWQTVAALIAILTPAIAIIRFISTLNKPPKTEKLLYIITVFLTVLLIAGTCGVIYMLPPSSQSPTPANTVASSSSSPSPTVTSATTGASLSPTSSATGVPNTAPVSANKTPITTSSTSTPTNYSAPQPGPGCDTGGGTWSSQGLNPFACGQPINPVSTGIWGYLSLQLPNNVAFSANNTITITGSPFGDQRWVACIGLAEIGASTGYLAAFCGNGLWSVYTISNNGTIIQPLKNNVPTSLRASTTISLTLSRNMLLFTVDTEHYQIPVSPIQLTKIAIGIEKNPGCDTCSVSPTNFSYIPLAN